MKTKKIAIDFEYQVEQGLQSLVCVSVHEDNGFNKVYWLWEGCENKEFLEYVKSNKDALWVAHCIELAEARCFITLGLNPMDYKWWDTYTVELVLQAGNNDKSERKSSLGLASLQQKYCGIKRDEVYKDCMREMIIGSPMLWDKQKIMMYCADDTKDLLQIMEKQREKYSMPRRYYEFFDIEKGETYGKLDPKRLVLLSRVAAAYAKIDMRGAHLNPLIEKMIVKHKEVADNLMDAFNARWGNPFFKFPKNGRGKATENQKLVRAVVTKVIKDFGIKNYPSTDKGELSLKKEDLKTLEDFSPFIADYRELKKKLDVFKGFDKSKIEEWLKKGKEGKKPKIWSENYNLTTKRIYPLHTPLGTVTGRCASTPKDGFVPGWSKTLRSLIAAPKGKCVVSLDYSGEENAIQSCWAKDEKIRDAYLTDDYYLTIGKQLGVIQEGADRKDPMVKKIRKRVKSMGLGLSYGMGIEKLADSLGTNVDDARDQSDAFKENFHNLFHLREVMKGRLTADEKGSRLVSGQSFFKHEDGTIYTYTHSDSNDGLNSTLNNPIQGSGAAILRNIVLNADKLGLDIIFTVHDEIYFECNEEELEEKISLAKVIMTEAFKSVCGDFCPIKIGEAEVIHYGEVKFHDNDPEYERQWNELVQMLK